MKSIIMANVLALVSILLSASSALADRLYIDPFEITGGETKEISINLDNSQVVTAFQTELHLPEGLELVRQGDEWMSLAERASSDHSLIVNTDGKNDAKLVCFSNTNTAFSGNEGAVVSMKVKADEGFEGGVISLSGIKLSDSSNQDIILENTSVNVTVVVLAKSVTLSESLVNLKVGQIVALKATVLPEDATDKTVAWASDNAEVATVDANGNVTAVGLGTANITATCGSVSATCVVTVVATSVKSVTLSQEAAELKVGQSVALKATVLPEDATDKTVTWASDNAEVATVDANGNVTAVGLGTAKITATCGSVSATCVVTVVATPVESILLSDTDYQLKAGESFHLGIFIHPDDATDQTVIWTSDNEAVAIVNDKGDVTGISIGVANITASCGSASASCRVSVVATEAQNIILNQETAQVKIGETFLLTATVYPEDATDKTVTWITDNEAVATVDANGRVTAIAPGEAYITARCGAIGASCHVLVVKTPVETILLTPDGWTCVEGESFTITATVLPEDATDKNLIWSSSDEDIATVDSEGNVTVLKEGSFVITATAADGSGVKAECTVNSTSGVEGISSESGLLDIYDLNGALIEKGAERNAIKSLTPGIYIIRSGAETRKLVVR